VSFGICPRVLGAEKEDLGRVIDPKNYNQQCPSCPITRGDTGASYIEPDQRLADHEQDSGGDGPDGNITPGDRRVGKYLVDGRK
jgi:hypothetical protein